MPTPLLKDPRQLVILPPAASADRLPPGTLPEVAIAGRSNVGKSSLINRLLGTRKAARVSATPGKTRLIHLYEIPGLLRLVDLPGYGYAKVSQKERNEWRQLIDRYLNDRAELKGVICLVDSRHEVSELDSGLLHYLAGLGIPAQPVLTKCDGLKPSRRAAEIRKRAAELEFDPAGLIATSAETGAGLEELARAVRAMAGA
ncbi:MAG: ribosome biogenesis GTP-binding protein YihA/YsxC [Deltaproteobacteria bacterium]|nr:ribosome biogenesis GTP-binding protein YihA/YsxC [Deltaproteobacteria bacterium]